MTRIPSSTRPDALRQKLADLRRRIDSAAASLPVATVTGWTDAMPRWVRVPVTYTDFAVAATTATTTILTLPAGTQITHQWIEPGTLFVSAVPTTWRMNVPVPATGASAGGTPKSVDVTTPDSLAQQASQEHIVTDPAGGDVTVLAQIDSGGTENADTLTQGDAAIHLLISLPGSTSDDLPHS